MKSNSLMHLNHHENIGGNYFDLKKFQEEDHADNFLNHFFVDPFKYH